MKDGDTIPKKSKTGRHDLKGSHPKKHHERRLCQKCAKYSPQSKDTHNTSQCRKWNEDGSRKTSPNNSNMISAEIMNCFATMQKQNAEVLKQLKHSSSKKKKSRRRRYEESSDSDSE